jgi:hypothetical protein
MIAIVILSAQSNQKGCQQKGFFAAHGLYQINQNHGLQNIALLLSLLPNATANIAMPFPTHKAITVLPDFARSCSADGEISSLSLL